MAKSLSSLRTDALVEADGMRAGIHERAFGTLDRERGMGLGGHIRRYVATFIALLVCIFPSAGSASQVLAPAPRASNGSDLRGAASGGATPFARRVDSPTIFPFMASRYEAAREAISGYQRSGVPLIALHGQEWQPAAKGEEPGLAYFVPEIVRFTHADLDHAVDILLILLLAICFVSGTAGTFFWLQNTPSRIAAITGIAGILLVTSLVGDIYMVESAIVVAVVPWTLYFSRRQKISTGGLVFFFFTGLGAALANLTRANAGTPVVLLLAVLLFAFRASVRKRILVAGSPSYQPVVPHHPFWHTVYCGLGYLNNDYGLKIDDETADNKVRSIKPGVEYLSPEYENILRTEVFRFAKSHPRFIFETLAAKSGLLFIILLVCSNLGLPSALLYRKPLAVEAAFSLVFALTAAQGLLAYPNPDYLLGYMAFAVLYGVLGIDFAVSHGVLEPLSKLWLHAGTSESARQFTRGQRAGV